MLISVLITYIYITYGFYLIWSMKVIVFNNNLRLLNSYTIGTQIYMCMHMGVFRVLIPLWQMLVPIS